jgi:hypothetical protein
MPYEAIVAIAEAAGATAATAATIATWVTIAEIAAAVYTVREDARRQRNAYNASLKDRYTMVRSTTEPRALVLGRQRVSGPVAYIGSYGTNREHLVMAVVLAAHEIDAVEAVYFDDEIVTLDGSGNVTGVQRDDLFTLTSTGATFTLSSQAAAGSATATVAYGSTVSSLTVSVTGDGVTATVSGGTSGMTGTVTISYLPAQSPWSRGTMTNVQETIAIDASGNGTHTLAQTPDGTVTVTYTYAPGGQDQYSNDLTPYTTVSGTSITVASSPYVSLTATINYPVIVANTSTARVKTHLGAAGQAADADMIANLSGIWDSAHTLTGLAYLVCEFDYSTDAFPNGLPNVSAAIRGAKVYDPRTGATAWSENPSLLMRHVATHALFGRLSAAQVNDAAISSAANVCDASTNYVVNGQTYTRALYTAGLVAKADQPTKAALDDLAKAMAGKWVFQNNALTVKAGSYVTPLQTLDETWLADSQGVQVQGGANRTDLINVATGKFVDASRKFVVTDFPRIEASSYLAIDGATLPLDITLNAVTFVGQAQQVIAAQMRDVRQGIRATLTCNMRAFAVEAFDTIYVTLSRFGWVNKVFEVLDTTFTIDGGIQLSLKETDSSIWALGTSFPAFDPAPNTLFPSPWQVPAVAGLACASGNGQLLTQADGVVTARMKVSWTPITDALVTTDGGIEVRYGQASQSEDQWQTVKSERGQSQVYITGLHEKIIYLVKARAFNALVKGAWCDPVLHQFVAGTSQIPTGSIVAGAATSILSDIKTSDTATLAVSFVTDHYLNSISYTNTSGVNVDVEVSWSSEHAFSVAAGYTGSVSAWGMLITGTLNGLLTGPPGSSLYDTPALTAGQSAQWKNAAVWHTTMAPSDVLVMQSLIRFVPNTGSGNVTINSYNATLRLAIIKR